MRIKSGRHKKRTPIPCLKCDEKFKSWNTILNRLCPKCVRNNRKKSQTHDHMEMTFLAESHVAQKISEKIKPTEPEDDKEVVINDTKKRRSTK